VSCASAGNCAAVGFYSTASLHHQAFVVSEVKGAWGRAEQVPGLAALDKGRMPAFVVDGSLDITSPPGGPTRVTAELPLHT